MAPWVFKEIQTLEAKLKRYEAALMKIEDEPNQIGVEADELAEHIKAWEIARQALEHK